MKGPVVYLCTTGLFRLNLIPMPSDDTVFFALDIKRFFVPWDNSNKSTKMICHEHTGSKEYQTC